MKIVHVVRSAGVGGVETHVLNLCRSQRASGMQVTLVSLVEGPVQPAFEQHGVPVIQLGDREAWSVRIWPLLWTLKATLRRLGPDIVHVHGARPIFIGSVAARLARRKHIVSTLHGSYRLMALDQSGRERPALRLLAKLVHFVGFALSGRILIDSQALEAEVAGVYRGLCWDFEPIKHRKVRLAYNSIDVDALDQGGRDHDLRTQLGLPSNTLVFGTVSRLDEPKKGLGVLLRAFASFAKEFRHVHLIICGGGWARELLEHQVQELGLNGQVTLLGFYENLPDVYRALNVFVLPSFSEGFPTVILEAMAFSLPVIATDVGGCREAVIAGRTGALVAANDVGALKTAMHALAQEPEERTRLGTTGRQFVESHFTVAKMAEAVRHSYAELITDPRAGGPQQASREDP
jgi:glycosyltransferase involved in cell wall biosynthesis